MKTIEILRKARELISVPERWTQGALARTKIFGARCHPIDPRAASWCAIGAIQRFSFPDPANHECLRLVSEAAGSHVLLSEFNDRLCVNHSDVIRLFDAAISRLESAE